MPTKTSLIRRPPKWRLFLLVGFLMVLIAFNVVKRLRSDSPVGNHGIPTSGGKQMSVKIDIDPYFQWDSRWKNEKLGETDASLKNYGCTVCATAMALTSRGIEILPNQLNQKLIENRGFTKSGLLIWKAVRPVSGNRFSIALNDKPDHQLLDRELEKNNPIIAKVLYQNSIWHWVLITGKEGSDYLIHDPLASTGGHHKMDEYPSGIFTVRYLE